jgi:hypothetical protein
MTECDTKGNPPPQRRTAIPERRSHAPIGSYACHYRLFRSALPLQFGEVRARPGAPAVGLLSEAAHEIIAVPALQLPAE